MALGGALAVAPRHFAWQAWHLATSTLISRGRRGTISHPRSFCVAGASLMALGGALGPGLVARDARSHTHTHTQNLTYMSPGRFVWQAPHSWHWVAPLGPV